MNKKGLKILGIGFEAGDSSSGLYALLIVIYFILFSFIAYSVDSVKDIAYDDTNSPYHNAYNSVRVAYNYCSSPRYFYEIGSSLPVATEYYNEPSMRCDQTKGILGETECEAIFGCDWETITTNSWTCWLPRIDCTTLDTCTGTMSGENVSDGNITLAILGNVAGYDYDNYPELSSNLLDYLGRDGYEGNQICSHPLVLQNQSSCEYFQCSWNSVSGSVDLSESSSSKNLLGMMTAVFKFDYVFNFDNTLLNTFLYLIFIVIPLLLLLMFIFYGVFG